jgi:hypothetical protein
MELGDIGRLELVTDTVRDLERRLPHTVECRCGSENVTTQAGEPVNCTCGVPHTFRSERTPS